MEENHELPMPLINPTRKGETESRNKSEFIFHFGVGEGKGAACLNLDLQETLHQHKSTKLTRLKRRQETTFRIPQYSVDARVSVAVSSKVRKRCFVQVGIASNLMLPCDVPRSLDPWAPAQKMRRKKENC